MTIESSGDGSDIFWPGYVDAVTNLVLNLLFLLTIMTVAVFMFAMELGKSQRSPEENKPSSSVQEKAADEVSNTQESELENMRRKVEALQRELQIANSLRAPQKVVSASAGIVKPERSIERAANISGGIVVKFADEAVTLTPAEAEKLRITLGPVVASGAARLLVSVPKGFSEAKRLGFYRAMAVRNLLMEMKVPSASIDVSVREGDNSSDASQVIVGKR
jgi:hypothetical protein